LNTIVGGWDGFAQVTGSASAALIGLLFVAVSIRINVIARSGDLRNRAAQTLSLLGIVLLVAIALSLPDQQRWIVGVEIMVVAVVASVTLRLLDRRANKQTSEQQIAMCSTSSRRISSSVCWYLSQAACSSSALSPACMC
jgi:MFS-type transporter involved in bile tolerance (Atg22 family)